jgi:hypothetical protein
MAYLGKTPSQAVRSRFYFTASGGETSLAPAQVTGLSFTDANYVDVSLNGVALVSGTDYTATPSTNTISSLSALTASDVVEIVVYDVFSVFGGNVNGDFTISNGTLAAEAVTVTGLTTTGNINFGDNDKAIFGAGSDFTIEHNGSKTKLSETGTGNLEVRGTNIEFLDGTGAEYYLQMAHNGAVTLYHDNAAKVATTSTGVDVTGTVTADGLTVDGTATITTTGNETQLTLTSTDADATTGPNMSFFRNSSSAADGDQTGSIFFIGKDDAGNDTTYGGITTHIVDASNTTEDGRLTISSMKAGTSTGTLHVVSGKVGIGTTSPDQTLVVKTADGGGIAVENAAGNQYRWAVNADDSFAVIDSGTAERMRIDSSGGLTVGATAPPSGAGGVVQFFLKQSAASNGIASVANGNDAYTRIYHTGSVGVLDTTFGASAGYTPLTFRTNGSERLRIDSSGRVGIGTSTPTNTSGLEIQTTSTTAGLWVQTGGTSSSHIISEFRNGANVDVLKIRGDASSIFQGNVGIGGSEQRYSTALAAT